MKIDQNGNRIPIKDSIIIDLKYELDNVNFSNDLEEIKSYYFIVSKLDEWTDYDDGSITEEHLMLLINYLQESMLPLSESFFNMIEMLESGRYPNAVS